MARWKSNKAFPGVLLIINCLFNLSWNLNNFLSSIIPCDDDDDNNLRVKTECCAYCVSFQIDLFCFWIHDFLTDLPGRSFFHFCALTFNKSKTPKIHSTLIYLFVTPFTGNHKKERNKNNKQFPKSRLTARDSQFIILLRIFIWLCKNEKWKKKQTNKLSTHHQKPTEFGPTKIA